MLAQLGRLHKNVIHSRIRLLFFCRKVIYFFNLGIENLNSLRQGSSPNRTDCIQTNWFNLFIKSLYLHILRNEVVPSLSSPLFDSRLFIQREGSERFIVPRFFCHNVSLSSSRWNTLQIPCFFTSSRVCSLLVCELLRKPSQTTNQMQSVTIKQIQRMEWSRGDMKWLLTQHF